MTTETTAPVSKGMLWGGRVASALPVLNLLISAGMKFGQSPEVLDHFGQLGYARGVAVPLAIVEVVCTLIYVIPRTAVLGAILLTGYLGGAVATHVRVGDPVGNILAPAFLGVLLWGGLWLRDPRLRALLPFLR
jgi:hypothetical protein